MFSFLSCLKGQESKHKHKCRAGHAGIAGACFRNARYDSQREQYGQRRPASAGRSAVRERPPGPGDVLGLRKKPFPQAADVMLRTGDESRGRCPRIVILQQRIFSDEVSAVGCVLSGFDPLGLFHQDTKGKVNANGAFTPPLSRALLGVDV